jgi:transposase-like protein
MQPKPKTVEEKEGCREDKPSFPSLLVHMKNSPASDSLQAHVEQFFNQLPEPISPQDLPQMLQLALSKMIEAALAQERQFHLQDHPEDRANGYAPQRTLHVGATPVSLERPRTRQGFYPALLPKHQRNLPEAYQELLQNILLGARSFAAARRTLQAMGLSYSAEQTEQLLQQLHQEARAYFTRPLAPDWFCLFADAKLIDLKDDQDHVRQAVHFLVLGIGMDGKKQVLTASTFWGNELLEAWRRVLIDLKNRGLTRALLWVTDDFSGLTGLLQGLFPHSYHQLCTVHLQRNAHRHLSPEDYATFKDLWKELCAASSPESAQAKFRSLLEQLRPQNKAWVEHVEKRSAHYMVFLNFPASLRAQLRSTNLPEGINNQIENLRRNAGGHFHSEREALIKMKLLTDQLDQTKWRRASPTITAQLASLNRLFQQRFEAELDPVGFLTQCF